MTESAKDRIAQLGAEHGLSYVSENHYACREHFLELVALATSLAEELDRRNNPVVTLNGLYDAGTSSLEADPSTPLTEAKQRDRVEAIGMGDVLRENARLEEELARERDGRGLLKARVERFSDVCPSCKGSQCCVHTEWRELPNGCITCVNGGPGCDDCATCGGTGRIGKRGGPACPLTRELLAAVRHAQASWCSCDAGIELEANNRLMAATDALEAVFPREAVELTEPAQAAKVEPSGAQEVKCSMCGGRDNGRMDCMFCNGTGKEAKEE